MKINILTLICTIGLSLLLTSCASPIPEDALSKVDRDTTLAMVHESPQTSIGKQLLIGGSIVSIDSEEDSTVVEVLEWRLSPFGDPIYIDDEALKFLVRTTRELGREYEAGVLVTLVGTLTGNETRLEDGVEYTYPAFNLDEIHLWESPLRYGTRRNIDPGIPHYEGATGIGRQNPYDPGYTDYPYLPYWLRSLTR